MEMSKSLRIEATTTSDAALKDSLLKRAQTYLDKFAQEKPSHPDALQAKLANAGFVGRAPAEVVQQVKDQVADLESQLQAIAQTLRELRGA